jgi:hypothetical protein
LVNILFIVLLELGNRETRLVRACLPFPRCEMCLVSMRLLSICSRTIYKFSPTSPTRGGAHQFLNPRQSNCFEDVTQLVLHTVLLAPGLQSDHWHTYVCVCIPTIILHVGASRIPWRITCRYSFFAYEVKGRHASTTCASI